MKKSLFIDFFKLAGAFGALWIVFLMLPINCSTETFRISIENEEKLGKLIAEELILNDPNIKVIKEPIIDSAVGVITARLLSNLQTQYNYKIQVINNPDVNAFTIPGGYIFINRGLIEFAERPEEVAAVLAHEIGHAEERHVLAKMSKEIGITILFSIITGGDPALIMEIGRQALSTVFDREQEKEADAYALKLLERSNIPPSSLAAFFKKLNEEVGGYDKNLEILMTHPHNEKRIEAAMQYATGKDFKPQPLPLNWEEVKRAVKQ